MRDRISGRLPGTPALATVAPMAAAKLSRWATRYGWLVVAAVFVATCVLAYIGFDERMDRTGEDASVWDIA
jgi:type VI protein secretion system component VasF